MIIITCANKLFCAMFAASASHPLDPPEHLLRLRLVCVLLDTCGQYFDKGSSKKKLDCFLTFFQVTVYFLIMSSSVTTKTISVK